MKYLVMTPGPTNIPDRVLRAMQAPMISHRCKAFRRLYAGLIEKGRAVFQTGGEIVMLTSSGTGAVEAAAANVVRRGDDVIVASFGEFGERLTEAVTRAGGNAIQVKASFGSAPRVDEIEDAFRRAKNVKALCTVSNETSTGVRFKWLKEAGELASAHGSFYIVDAVSNFAGDEMPVDALGIDVLATCTHKCLAAPPGLALLAVSPRVKKHILDNPPSVQYFDLSKYFRFTERQETPFTPSVPLFYALDEAFNLIIDEGLPARFRRHRMCAEAFYAAFEAMGFQGFAEQEVRSNTVIAIRYPEGVDDRGFRGILEDRFRIHIAGGFGEYRGKIFRIGCMGEVGAYHVLTTLSSIASTLSVMGLKGTFQDGVPVAHDRLKELQT